MTPKTPPEKRVWTGRELGQAVVRLLQDFVDQGGRLPFLFYVWRKSAEMGGHVEVAARQRRLRAKARKLKSGLVKVYDEVERVADEAARAGAGPLEFAAGDGTRVRAAALRDKLRYWISLGSTKEAREGKPSSLHGRVLTLAAIEPYMKAHRMADKAWRERWLRDWLAVTEAIPSGPAALAMLSKLVKPLHQGSAVRFDEYEVERAFMTSFPTELAAAAVHDPLKSWLTRAKRAKDPSYPLLRRMGRMIAEEFLKVESAARSQPGKTRTLR